MSEPQSPPPKPDVARALLARGHLFLHLDPRVSGVRVPEYLQRQPQLVLQVGFDMPVPVPDLRVEREGLGATLSFQRTPFPCWVPWDAVFALLDEGGQGVLWPESLPPEIAAEVSAEMDRSGRAKEPAPRARSRSRAARVPESAASPSAPEPAGEPAPRGASRGRARTRRAAEPASSAAPTGEPAPSAGARKAPAVRSRASSAPRPPAAPPVPPNTGGLRAVPGGRSGDAAARPRSGERPSYLRVVK
jgi:stringent starvation protein B